MDKSLQGWTGTDASKHRSIMWLDVAHTFTCNEIDSLNLLSVLFNHFIQTFQSWEHECVQKVCFPRLETILIFLWSYHSLSWNKFSLAVIPSFTFVVSSISHFWVYYSDKLSLVYFCAHLSNQPVASNQRKLGNFLLFDECNTDWLYDQHL